MNTKRSLHVAAWPMAIALLLTPTAGRADLPLYTDGELHGWTDPTTLITRSWIDYSWGAIAADLHNPSPVQSGNASIALTFNAGWSALNFTASPPLDSTGVEALRFWVNGGEEGGQQDLWVTLCDSTENNPTCKSLPLAPPAANQWTLVELPLAGLAVTKIAQVQWNNLSGDAKSTLYLDDIVLVGAPGGDGTVPIFTDFASPNWNFWNTNTETRVVAAPTHSGTAALAVDSLEGWNTMQLGHIASVENVAGLYTLRFWLHGGDTGGQKIKVSASNDEGLDTPRSEVTAPANAWTKVEIPLAELGNPLSVYALRWWNGSAEVMPTFYLDDIALVPGPGPVDQGPVDRSLVYGDSLTRGWVDLSANPDQSPVAELASTTAIHGGTTAIKVDNLKRYGLAALGHQPLALAIDGYDTLRFFIHGGDAGQQQLKVEVVNEDFAATEPLEIRVQAGVWTQVDIPLKAQLSPLSVYVIRWWNNSDNDLATFYLDDIGFVNATGTPPPSVGTGPSLSVDAARDRHPISPYIYGMNNPEEALAQDLRLPVNRWGGNQTSTYNWRHDTYNTGFDWFYENISNSTPASLPDGSSANRFIEQNRRIGSASLMTMPMIGWVAKRWKGNHPFDCAFKISVYGPQLNADWQWEPDCGNGVSADGTPITANDPEDIAIASGPQFVYDWITYLRARYGTATAGGVAFYALDNEPMLWNSTHNEVFKHPLSTDELIALTYAYAPAIKAADPGAKVFGPVFWGWCAYFYSAVDNCTNNGTADFEAHGSVPLVVWYLRQMRAYEEQHGVRILDYLDLHGYPNAAGIYSSAVGNQATQTLRLRSTRQLWDPTYQDESWVPAVIQLIPRMRAWVNENYPGTKLALTEYSWGAPGFMNGALAQADILGIFGREGLDLAALWDPPKSTQPVAHAFRMYLNYDGQGATFGDTGVQAASTDQEKLAIYAAQQGTRLTLMIVNKTGLALTSPVALAGFRPAATAQVYRYSAAHLAGIVRVADQALTDTGFTGVFPPSSITLIVADQAGIDLAVTGYTQLSRQRVDAYNYQYTYRVEVTNRGGAGTGVTGALHTPYPPGMSAVAATLSLGDLAPGAKAAATISFRQDRRHALRPEALVWSFTGQ